jgi:hypothetical protein
MSLVALEENLAKLKNTVEGNLKDLVLKLEAVLHHVKASHVEPIVKDAVYTELHTATVKVSNIANEIRMESDLADKVIDTTADAVDKATKTK